MANVIEFPLVRAVVDTSEMPTELLANVLTGALFALLDSMDAAARSAGLPSREVSIRALPSPELLVAITRPGAVRFEIDGAPALVPGESK